MQKIVIVNASHVIPDDEVRMSISAFQTQLDRDFYPAWKGVNLPQCILSFVPASVIYSTPGSSWPIEKGSWPIFLNKHSTDDNALGWHTDEINKNFPIHGRVFAGDCLRFGLKWTVTLGHEILELIADAKVTKVWRMPNGWFAAYEVCDAVEADEQAYPINNILMTNFVFPRYFSSNKTGPFDFRGVLKGPCPTLSPGGYMSILKGSRWTQIYANRNNELAGRRTLLQTYRKEYRKTKGLVEEIISA